MKRLPDNEFDLMMVIWQNPSPITTRLLMEKIGKDRGWKAPVLITMLNRLIEKGFVRSEKDAKLRYYYPVVDKNVYIEYVTTDFIEKYHGGSFTSLFAYLFDIRKVSDETLLSFVKWVHQHRDDFRRYFPK